MVGRWENNKPTCLHCFHFFSQWNYCELFRSRLEIWYRDSSDLQTTSKIICLKDNDAFSANWLAAAQNNKARNGGKGQWHHDSDSQLRWVRGVDRSAVLLHHHEIRTLQIINHNSTLTLTYETKRHLQNKVCSHHASDTRINRQTGRDLQPDSLQNYNCCLIWSSVSHNPLHTGLFFSVYMSSDLKRLLAGWR